MLIDDTRARTVLRSIVWKLTADPTVQEDLLQEAMIHLWLEESRRPGQTKSWYLQNCQFYLRNLLTKGRSVDSRKRARNRVEYFSADEVEGDHLNGNAEEKVLEAVSVKDLMIVLSQSLTDREQQILWFLSLGFGAREIARRLGISHPAVVKHRQHIARQAIKLGIDPLPGSRGAKASRVVPIN